MSWAVHTLAAEMAPVSLPVEIERVQKTEKSGRSSPSGSTRRMSRDRRSLKLVAPGIVPRPFQATPPRFPVKYLSFRM